MIVQDEVIVFFLSCLLGGFFSFYYDCFRLFRQIIPHYGVIVFFEDILYFSSCAIIAFSFIVSKAAGEIRGFVFVGFIFGYILYFFTISIVFMKVWRFIFKVIKKVLLTLWKLICVLMLPFKLLFIAFHYFFTKFFGFFCRIMKKCKKI